MSEEHKRKIGIANAISKLGKKHTPKHNKNISKAHIGLHWRVSEQGRKNMSLAKTGMPRPDKRGEKSNFWKGGISKERTTIYNSLSYRNWRLSVFERDNYTCQFCGEFGGLLEAHHIRPFALFPSLRFDTPNGITLCKGCHSTTISNVEKIDFVKIIK